MRISGPALGITGGHCDNNLLPSEFHHKAEGVADGPWAARAKVRETVKYGADLIKICASGGVLSKGDQPGTPQYTLEEMQAIAEEATNLAVKSPPMLMVRNPSKTLSAPASTPSSTPA